MKTFKQHLSEINGLRYMYENLRLSSGIGRKLLNNSQLITNEFMLKVEFGNMEEMYKYVHNHNNRTTIRKVTDLLQQINDIHTTLKNISQEQTVDDVELFEIKKFSIIAQQISQQLQSTDFDILLFHNLDPVIDLLDPEKKRVPTFYIYSDYDARLQELRKEQKNIFETNPEKAEMLYQRIVEIEDDVRSKLSKQLAEHTEKLKKNLEQLAYLDLLIAKVVQAKELNLCRPEISKTHICYKSLFSPHIKALLEQQGKRYQPIDIDIYNHPTLITGANMSGKTVLLKTIILSQYLFQYGFYVPAASADIFMFDKILYNIDDKQSELSGLSSFAIEMKTINAMIRAGKSGEKILALVDELARTTNPEEGKALVSAFLDIMTEHHIFSLVTTHYSGVASNCRRLQVSGLNLKNENINIANINDYMDYSLNEVYDDNVPTEALKIAEILGVDAEFTSKALKYVKREL